MKFPKSILVIILIIISILLLSRSSTLIFAACSVKDYDNPEEYQKAIEECQKEIDVRATAQSKNKEDLAALEKNLAATQALIKSAEKQIDRLENEIGQREQELNQEKEVLAAKVRSFYKKSRHYSPFLLFLSSGNAADLLRELSYRQTATNEDKESIITISQNLKTLIADKEISEKNKAWLAASKNKVEQQAKTLRIEVEKVEGYFSDVSNKIAQLSTKQQALLNARSGTFTTSVGDVPLADDPASRPDYDPGFRPAFAAFSFGAWTHRKGMSQYGAKGRAESGQNSQQILQAYYQRTPVGKDTGGTILVSGFGALDFENYYLLGIAEMPSSFPTEALKAQAIAARSYAYRYKAEGKSICTTQACQVFSQSKAGSPPAQWKAAVEATRGQVIEGVVTYYSSATGGYLSTSGWDTTCGNSSCWTNGAYEKIANSPWFYKGWYTESYTNNSAKCGRSHPWLTAEEMADILNAWLVLNKQSGDDRILPVTFNQCGGGGNPYSANELRDKANGLGGAFASISSISVTYGNNGETSSLTFSTNRGNINIPGAEFKQAFNLRAPGYIAIRSPLFNIEKK